MLDAVERSCWDLVDKVVDTPDGPDHVKVHLELGTNVVLTAADMSVDELEASGGEACT